MMVVVVAKTTVVSHKHTCTLAARIHNTHNAGCALGNDAGRRTAQPQHRQRTAHLNRTENRKIAYTTRRKNNRRPHARSDKVLCTHARTHAGRTMRFAVMIMIYGGSSELRPSYALARCYAGGVVESSLRGESSARVHAVSSAVVCGVDVP